MNLDSSFLAAGSVIHSWLEKEGLQPCPIHSVDPCQKNYEFPVGNPTLVNYQILTYWTHPSRIYRCNVNVPAAIVWRTKKDTRKWRHQQHVFPTRCDVMLACYPVNQIDTNSRSFHFDNCADIDFLYKIVRAWKAGPRISIVMRELRWTNLCSVEESATKLPSRFIARAVRKSRLLISSER